MEDLVKLPGIGRKTANVILGVGFDVPGFAVDTHVKRLTNLLGLVVDPRPGEDRAAGVLDGAEGGVDRAVAAADPARAADLYRAPAAVRGVRPERLLPVVD